jgi:hypothetical protein
MAIQGRVLGGVIGRWLGVFCWLLVAVVCWMPPVVRSVRDPVLYEMILEGWEPGWYIEPLRADAERLVGTDLSPQERTSEFGARLDAWTAARSRAWLCGDPIPAAEAVMQAMAAPEAGCAPFGRRASLTLLSPERSSGPQPPSGAPDPARP